MTLLRNIGNTNIQITPIAMGCWPISGVTSVDVTEQASLATLNAAFDSGINFFDTAYCYGYEGESERLIARALGEKRDQIVIATKGGIHWAGTKQIRDASPERIKRECDESLERLNTDRVELYYLHGPDPEIPVSDSAGAFKELLEAGKILSVGVSNFTLDQLQEFSAVCPISAYQPRYNMLQREIEADRLPWCIENQVSVMVYWPLMKGLLAGKLARDHQFAPEDGRQKYPMFHGEEWEKNQDFLDQLRSLANEFNRTIAQVVIRWTIQQTGITCALCGAKRPEQIEENAEVMNFELSASQIDSINHLIQQRGPICS
ncbi:MAG: aldo/keto reductase [Planctomycetes bacterium]|nr:aldo/keto reductase [Planctomycetota bacterium]MCH9727355.1 aldo/keto reductase [Planctomycetota bacterium]MCH9776985.1 aldo/keto reductase [Planctomycetota bacterium]MDF1745001.1 aldo/keto reductase [Gimesia sp.]